MNPKKNGVKVIFFDAGGVLFDTPIKGDDRVRSLLIEKGYGRSQIDAALRKVKSIKLPFITNWNEEERYYRRYYGVIAEGIGQKDVTDELFTSTHYAGHCELFPEVQDVLMNVSKEYRLAVISNAMPSMDSIFDRLGIRNYFDTIILSAFVGEEKPSEAIYQIALNETQTLGEDCLFIDDKNENVEGARRVGIKGLHLDRNKQNLAELLRANHLLTNEF
ncbi:HAD family hydrolase [Sporosarcina sp. ACRSL]|uniref:HAD family hydrolase n=1 Tax=Sporosarcina sp. ACRSL TaxID=2918215 RepID=UPI001EF5D25C|nr:HAD family hydrolase [Sporosarcina sp. ACRSL]MCG7345447.1 HAD family hydrolase [Sporosarcina sp. ACRSL]